MVSQRNRHILQAGQSTNEANKQWNLSSVKSEYSGTIGLKRISNWHSIIRRILNQHIIMLSFFLKKNQDGKTAHKA